MRFTRVIAPMLKQTGMSEAEIDHMLVETRAAISQAKLVWTKQRLIKLLTQTTCLRREGRWLVGLAEGHAYARTTTSR
jgi:hypothetical protein